MENAHAATMATTTSAPTRNFVRVVFTEELDAGEVSESLVSVCNRLRLFPPMPWLLSR